jgi:serine/threonine protein kinase/tetratricopeptide (TPR) repeat protein/TolB-like protein
MGHRDDAADPTVRSLPSALEVGNRVGHVRLARRLGHGGMGEVWEGFDEVLLRRVAVKAIHQQRRAAPGGRERFLREARLLSQLDHPNICRVYELVEGVDTDCLVLELVEGESLKQAARRGLSETQKLAIGEQIAVALAVAHERRIVHRDLKPDNVMVTPAGAVKVLDFGIARLLGRAPAGGGGEEASGGDRTSSSAALEGDPPSDPTAEPSSPHAPSEAGGMPPTLDLRPPATVRQAPSSDLGSEVDTLPGAVLGTLRYMSPEQATGRPVTESSDLYSLGILLQELCTGADAYAGSRNPLELRDQVIAGKRVPMPGAGMDPELVALIGELLRSEPALRPTAAEVAARLAALRAKPERRRRRRLAVAAGLAALALIAVAVAVAVRLARPSPLVAPGSEVRVAVLPFANATGETGNDWVELGLQQMVATALRRGEGVDVARPEWVAETLTRLEVTPAVTLSGEQATRLVEALGSDLLVATAMARDAERLRVDYAVYDAGGPLARSFLLADDPVSAARGLAEALGRRLSPGAPIVDLEKTFSRDAFANQAYAIGVQRSRTTGAAAGEPYFRVCLDRDPKFARAQLRLADARFRLGEPAEAENLVAGVAAAAEQAGDARLQVEAVRQLAELAQEKGDYAVAEERLRRVLALLAATPDEELEVRVINHLGVLRYRQGDFAAAREHLERALEIARQGGYVELEPPVLTPLAYLHLQEGDRAGAEELFLAVQAGSRRVGHREWEAGALANLANLRLQQGDLEAAGASSQQAHDLFTALGSVKGQLVTAINLGAVRLHQGDLAEAERLTRRGLALAREVDDRRSEAFSLGALGYFASRGGRPDEADESLHEASRLAADMGDRELTWQIARNLAYLRILQGRLPEAERQLARALEIKRDGLTMLVEARLAYAAGDLERAAALLAEVRERGDVPWAPWRDDVLATYRLAAAEGRSQPLPDEAAVAAAGVR